MKLIGAGLPRTGTMSQKLALEILGLDPCYHMANIFADLNEATRWRAAFAGELDPAEILKGFPAMVDWPGSYYYKELMETYPEAKVLLSVRDGDKWAESMTKTIWGLLYGDTLAAHMSAARASIDPLWDAYIEGMKDMWDRSGLLVGKDTTPEYMRDACDRYNAEVQAYVPADRLLVWAPADGWEPLCAFLGVPVPDQDFPRVNDSSMFDDRIIDPALAIIGQHQAEHAA